MFERRCKMIKQKKGISGVITMLIIVALALVAVGAVWYVIQNILDKGTAEVDKTAGDLFNECPTADVTDATDSGSVCLSTEKIVVTIDGVYCCVAK